MRKFDCDICFTPMIVAPDFMRSVKARDSEFTTNEGNMRSLFFFKEILDASETIGIWCLLSLMCGDCQFGVN